MIFLGREYEVLDLGSEGGFDSFLAAPKVGPTGQVVRLDMSCVRSPLYMTPGL